MSNLSALLKVTHLSWATWAILSRSLIFLEKPERFATSRSIVLSDLSESLTVTKLIWAKWANEQIPSHGSSRQTLDSLQKNSENQSLTNRKAGATVHTMHNSADKFTFCRHAVFSSKQAARSHFGSGPLCHEESNTKIRCKSTQQICLQEEFKNFVILWFFTGPPSLMWVSQ